MEKIASFTVDHNKLLPGLYISRIDENNGFFYTTFDLRFVRPNSLDIMDTTSIHSIEHLGATYFRNTNKDTMYFGPMGCRTGFYLIIAGKKEVSDIKNEVIACLKFILDYEGDIPGASAMECGNFRDLNLVKAKIQAKKYLKVLTKEA